MRIREVIMPNYFDLKYFKKSCDANTFDAVHSPGEKVGVSGIYICESCGFEAFFKVDEQLPTNVACKDHSPFWTRVGEAAVSWRLIASTIEITGLRI